MRKPVLLIILLSSGFLSEAQIVQWASRVLEFSSELTPIQYSSKEILGKPNVLPAGGQNPGAWTPDKPGRREFIRVGFDSPMNIQQVAIAESYNPSALFRVAAFDEAGQEHEIHTFNPMVIPLKGRMRNIFIERTAYKVVALRLEFDGSAIPDYFSIDAVAIVDSPYPVVAAVPQPESLAPGVSIERLDDNVNSSVSDLNPILSPDGQTLYFSRRNHPENTGGIEDKEDIWYSTLDTQGKWTLARNLGPTFNTAGPNFVNSIAGVTPDGKSAIMILGNQYLEKGKSLAGISMSTQVGGEWTSPRNMVIKDDHNYSDKANYFLANSRRTLLMSVERGDTHGDRDLYVSFMENDSTWTAPLNLGDVVNTTAEESGPFLAPDDVTLYFSSKGFSGFGGSDVYVSKRLDDTWTRWSEPQNMGPAINSPDEETFFNIPANSDFAYYSRGPETNADIYRIKMPLFVVPEPVVVVKGKLLDARTGSPIGAKIVYERLPDGKVLGEIYSDPKTGEYELHLPAGHLYGVRAEAKDHISSAQNIDLRDVKDAGVVKFQDFMLQPIEMAPIDTGVTITLNNIFFDFDRSTLRPESFPELNRLAALMAERPTLEVEVSGHADATGPAEYNLGLSKRRARAVVNYLIKQGTAESRIRLSFYGESKPIATNATLEGRRKNRRVEFSIVKK
jgi:outer membrane protein OmpA-like peptidoglycan-associated protein